MSKRIPSGLWWSHKDNRWHLGAQGIHAGQVIEILGRAIDVKVWVAFRVESEDSGRDIFCVTHMHGFEWRLPLTRNGIARRDVEVRWPA